MRPVLIQCVGNPYAGDDGLGAAVAERLRRLSLPAGVEVSEHWGEGAELMQHWPGRRRVILVDAAASGAAPGTLHRIDAVRDTIGKNLCVHSTHRFGVAEAVELARSLEQLPPSVYLIAVEGENFAPGQGLSPAVAAALEQVVESCRALAGSEAGSAC